MTHEFHSDSITQRALTVHRARTLTQDGIRGVSFSPIIMKNWMKSFRVQHCNMPFNIHHHHQHHFIFKWRHYHQVCSVFFFKRRKKKNKKSEIPKWNEAKGILIWFWKSVWCVDSVLKRRTKERTERWLFLVRSLCSHAFESSYNYRKQQGQCVWVRNKKIKMPPLFRCSHRILLLSTPSSVLFYLLLISHGNSSNSRRRSMWRFVSLVCVFSLFSRVCVYVSAFALHSLAYGVLALMWFRREVIYTYYNN